MSCSYVVTAQKATAVTHSVLCNFISNNEKSLIIAKGNQLELYSVRDGDLIFELSQNLYGKIKSVESYRPVGGSLDLLFILTERKSFCVLGYDPATGKVVTRAAGNVNDRAGRDIEIGQRGFIDPDGRMIGMLLYEGQLKVVPIEPSGMKEAFNIPINEPRVIDMKFLHGCLKPTVCVLYQDNRQIRHVKTFVVDVREKDLTPGPWSQGNVEYGATTIIPLPAPIFGVLLLGACSITYMGGASSSGSGNTNMTNNIQAVEISPTLILSYTMIASDGSRFLFADHRGILSVLVLSVEYYSNNLKRNGSNGGSTAANTVAVVTGLTVDTLGTTSIAETMSFCGCYSPPIDSDDNSSSMEMSPSSSSKDDASSSSSMVGLVFIGSIFGDSQLIQLLPQRDAQGSHIHVLRSYTNIGPILDMCLVGGDDDMGGNYQQQQHQHNPYHPIRSGSSSSSSQQRQLVTCSGAYKDGSLCVIRSGIGIQEQASMEVASGIKGVWSLRANSQAMYDKYLVQSFLTETRILSIEEEQLEEIEISGFLSQEPTIYCSNMMSDTLLQVTAHSVRLVDCTAPAFQLLSEYVVPCGHSITVATGTTYSQIVVAVSGGELIYLEIMRSDDDDDSNSSDINNTDTTNRRKLKIVKVAEVTLDQDIACLSIRPVNNKIEKFHSDVNDSSVIAPENVSIDLLNNDDDSSNNNNTMIAMEVTGSTAAAAIADSSKNNNNSNSNSYSSRSTLLAIGMWTDNSVRLLALPTLQEVQRVQLGTPETQARDIIITELGTNSSSSSSSVTDRDGTTTTTISSAKVYLMVGLGDGRLITYTIEDADLPPGNNSSSSSNSSSSGSIEVQYDDNAVLPALKNKRSGVIGTHPITFTSFMSGDALCVFAACDRPTVIYSKNNKLLFSIVDVRQQQQQSEFTDMAPFHSELFPHCLALSSESSLLIGVIEDVQKVHVQKIPLDQAPRRITHSPSNAIYAVLADKTTRSAYGGEETLSRVLFFDEGSMEPIGGSSAGNGVFELDRLEQGLSCITCTFDNTATITNSNVSALHHKQQQQPQQQHRKEYIVVGTARVVNGETEPTRGRILIFELTSEQRRINLVAEQETKGAVFCLASICGRLAAGINSKVAVFSFQSKEEEARNITTGGNGSSSSGGFAGQQPELRLECMHSSHIMTMSLRAKDDGTLLVGDLVRSMTLLRYKPAEKTLVEIARDYNSNYMRAIEIMPCSSSGGEDIYIGTDTYGNLFTMRYLSDALTDEERCKLQGVGEFHVGDYLNCFRRGSLVGQLIDPDVGGGGSNSSNNGNISTIVMDTGSSSSVDWSNILNNNYVSVTGLKSSHGTASTSSVLFGGVSGAIGSIIALSEDSHRFFCAVEQAVKKLHPSLQPPIGGLSHAAWRSFQNDLRTLPQHNMIDGDIVELCLDMDKTDLDRFAQAVNDDLNILFADKIKSGGNNSNGTSTGALLVDLAAGAKIQLTGEDIIRRVEDMARLH